MVKDIRPFLIEQARFKKTVTYDVMNNALDLGLDFKNHRHYSTLIGEYLDEISEHEVSKERPMLSSIVIRQTDKRQGNGFYELYAKLYGGHPDNIKRDKSLEEDEIKKCFKFWSNEEHYNKFKDDF